MEAGKLPRVAPPAFPTLYGISCCFQLFEDRPCHAFTGCSEQKACCAGLGVSPSLGARSQAASSGRAVADGVSVLRSRCLLPLSFPGDSLAGSLALGEAA